MSVNGKNYTPADYYFGWATRRLGINGLDAIAKTLGVESVKPVSFENEWYANEERTMGYVTVPGKGHGSGISELPLSGTATVGVFDYKVVAEFSVSSFGKTSSWSPMTWCRLLDTKVTEKQKLVARFSMAQMIDITSGLGASYYGPPLESLFVFVDRESSQAVLATDFTEKGTFGERLSRGEIRAIFDLPEKPADGEIIILQRRIRHVEKVPFDLKFEEWKQGDS